jgi:propanol-preferring alcohol dehydrogenase
LHGLYRRPEPARYTPGHEPAGEIADSWPDSRWKPGDRVALYGIFGCGSCDHCRAGYPHCCSQSRTIGFSRDGADAQYVLVPEHACLPLPDDLSFDVGALLGDGLGVPYHALGRAHLCGADTLAVFGLGPIGLGVVLVGRYLGARVIGIDLNPHRLSLARELGAEATLNSRELDVVPALRDLTEGRGPGVVAECAGSAATLGLALEAVAKRGRVVLIGENREASISPSAHFLRKELVMTGSTYFPLGKYEEVLRLARRVAPERLISHRFPLAQAREAFELFDRGETAKVALVP